MSTPFSEWLARQQTAEPNREQAAEPVSDELAAAQAAEAQQLAWLWAERAKGLWPTIDTWIVDEWVQPGGLQWTPEDLAAKWELSERLVHSGLVRLMIRLIWQFGSPESQALADERGPCLCGDGLTDQTTCPWRPTAQSEPRLFTGQYL